MAGPLTDFDRFFSGKLDAATPSHLLEEGTVPRILNGRLIEGAITNAIGFDEIPLSFVDGPGRRYFSSRISYDDIFNYGDPQLLAPLSGADGDFLVFVLSGRMFLCNPANGIMRDITIVDERLPDNSFQTIMSFIGNEGGSAGIGGTLVVFNDMNRPIFVTARSQRLSSRALDEMPPSRMGVTAGNRAFVFSGNNIMWASDPVGVGNAPLTFTQTYQPSTGFTGQIFTIGSVLDGEYITGAIRLPKFLGPSTAFTAQNLCVSTRDHKFIGAAENARDTWDTPGSQFMTYAGSGAGFAGPWAATVLGQNIIDITWQGRIKTIAQDQEKDTGMYETFFDNPLGQYLNLDEFSFYYREWYKDLDHSRSSIRYNGNRVFATVYPIKAPSYNRFGQYVESYTHRALAVAPLDSNMIVGPVTHLAWEGFYDWLKPALTVILGDDYYVFSKELNGRNTLYRVNNAKRDTHRTVIYTRAYFGNQADDIYKEKELTKGQLYFRRIWGNFPVRISQLVNGVWEEVVDCRTSGPTLNFPVHNHSRTSSFGIPLRIELDHGGCVFELESVRVQGEGHIGY